MSSSSTENLRISLQEILSATNKFAEENIIGRGGYGLVYRGQSEQHGMLAIKRLNRAHGQGDHEYGMEVTLLSKYKHENLVSLIGFCGEDGEKILVYKYETNQSLDKFLNSKDLSWIRRLKICLGAASGLRYLHNGESGRGHGIIHRDIKSSNILLDENWNAKIADFGLSKIALTNSADSIVFTVPCGTYGYVDPQILYGGITQKSDVYSFGVVLYEVLFGKLATIPGHLVGGRFTVEMAKKHHENNTLHMMIDPDLKDQMTLASLSKFSTVAYECVQNQREDRPTMSLVVEALEQALRYQPTVSSGLSSVGWFSYDVYISLNKNIYDFKLGRENSPDLLCDALESEGFSIYKGNINGIGKESAHLSAMNQSRSFIIVFCERLFDFNSWYMDEIKEIMKCVKGGNILLPVYLNGLDRSDIEEIWLTSSHLQRKVWRKALAEAITIPGLQLSSFNNIDDDFLKNVVAIIKGQTLEKAVKSTMV